MAEEEEEKQNLQARVERALFSRLQYFKENDSTITLASVRRLLEEDLGLEKHALDEHRKFVKQFIEEHLYCDDRGSKKSEENLGKSLDSSARKVIESPKKLEKDKDLRGSTPKDEPNVEEDSPIMGLLTNKVDKGSPQEIEISESMIKKAILKRADHIRSNSEALSFSRARGLLEEDLGLDKNALEPFKKFIRKQIEEVLEPPKASKSVIVGKKAGSGNCPSGEGRSNSKDKGNKEEEDTAEPREKKAEKSNRLKRSRNEDEPKNSSKKSKISKKQAEQNSEAENDGGVSDDGGSQSSAEKPAKKKPISTSVHGKHVEHLKSIIKACGMSVPPSVYKKAKQVPDNKRESFLTKELEDILSKERLSSNPTEKEIKEVRKRKERAKELEGIDISNIVTSSRRRSTSIFMAPPMHKKQDEGRDKAKGTKKDSDVKNNDTDKDDKDEKDNKDEKHNEAEKHDKDEKHEEEEEKDEEEEEEEEEQDDDDDDDSDNDEFNEDDNESD